MSRVTPSFDTGFQSPGPPSQSDINAALAAAQMNYAQYPIRINNAIGAQLGQANKALSAMQTTVSNTITRQLKGKATTLQNLQAAVQQPIVSGLELGYANLPPIAPSGAGQPAAALLTSSQPAPAPSPPQQYELRNQLLGLSGPGGFPTQVKPCACDDAGLCFPPGCDTIGGGNNPPPVSDWFCYRRTDGSTGCNIFGQGIPLPPDFQSIISGPYTTLIQCQQSCQEQVTPPTKAYYCVYQGAAGVNCVYCDGSTNGCNGDIVGGPYTTSAECMQQCQLLQPPPPPPGGWYCLQKRDDPQTTDCQQAPFQPDLLQLWRVLSGPYPDQTSCQAACKIGILGCPPPVCPPPNGPPGCCPPATITSVCPPPVIQNLITVQGGGVGTGTGTLGTCPPPIPCSDPTNPSCQVTQQGEPCPKPEGGDQYWWLDTCSDDAKLGVANEYAVNPHGLWSGSTIGQWLDEQLASMVGAGEGNSVDGGFLE